MMLIFICFVIVNLDFVLGTTTTRFIPTCVDLTASPMPSSTGVQVFLGNISITNNSRIYTSCSCDLKSCGSAVTVLQCIISNNGFSTDGRWDSPSPALSDDTDGRIAFCTSSQNGLRQCGFAGPRHSNSGYRRCADEGVYTCRSAQAINTNEFITIGVYPSTSTTPLSAVSLSITNRRFELTSMRNADPLQFSLSFTVMNGPVTNTICTVNDTTIYFSVTQHVCNDTSITESLIVLRFQSRNEGQYNCVFSGNDIIDRNGISMQSIPMTTNIRVIHQKPTNFIVHWINCSNTALARWSAIPSNSDEVIGYEIFYEVIGRRRLHYTMTTEETEAMIPDLIGCLNYSFCVVAYSNQEYTLPSECSNTVLLTNNVMSPCADQCMSTSGSSYQSSQIQTCVETLLVTTSVQACAASSSKVLLTSSLSALLPMSPLTLSSLQLSVTEARVSPSQLTGTVCLSQLESSLQSPLVAGIIGILLLTNLLTVTALIGSCVCILRLKQNKLTLGRGTSHYEQITLTESSHISTAGIVTNNNSESHNTGTAMVNNSSSSGGGDGNVSGNIYTLVSEEQDIDQHVPNQYETPIDLIKQQPITTTTTTGDGAATGGGSPVIYSIQDENPTTSVAASTAAAGQYTYAKVNKRQEGTVPTEGYTYATVNKKQSTKEQ